MRCRISVVLLLSLGLLGALSCSGATGTSGETSPEGATSAKVEPTNFAPERVAQADPAEHSDETEACIYCHTDQTPGIVVQWQGSSHSENGVGCFECHSADEGDVDALAHNGETISIIVSPTDCSACHAEEVAEFTSSHHAEGGQILDSLDNRLAEVVEGALTFNGESPVAVMGCAYCHGSVVEVEEGGTLTASSYPNSGIGRINPDGSWGSCSACHTRHDFAQSEARRPENCGRCHLGPDHPQIEIYTESQHGIRFASNEDDMALDSDTWVVGQDYTAAPTCATCHMGATPTQEGTHDVGTRLSWVLRSPISAHRDSWEDKRDAMTNVCSTCHSPGLISNYYEQVDAGVDLYNSKFAQPATDIYNAVRGPGLISAATFDDEFEWAYWHLWHHEGRRARSGLAMLGPDYVQWHGFYDIAERFYFEVIPGAREIAEHHLNTEAADYNPKTDEAAQAVLDLVDSILAREEHTWFTGNE